MVRSGWVVLSGGANAASLAGIDSAESWTPTNRWGGLYNLPGEVLRSPEKPTRTLDTPLAVAQELDAYVQPRFRILRDKNFGATRIVYRRHAGIVQLKVDTDDEKRRIANVNAAGRDYAICLLHCAPKPNRTYSGSVRPQLQLLYFNQTPIARDWDINQSRHDTIAREHDLDVVAIEQKAIAALPDLKAGREKRIVGRRWDLLMRPVPAAHPECTGCHTDAKPGATLGVMVYAVAKSLPKAPQDRPTLTAKKAP